MKKTYFSTMGMAFILGALPCWASSSPLEEVVQQRVLKTIVTLKLDKVGVKVFFSEMKRQTGLISCVLLNWPDICRQSLFM